MGFRSMALIHFLLAFHFGFGSFYDWYFVKIPLDVHRMGSSFGRTEKLKFLTFWNALLQSLFFTICFINDLIGSNEEHPTKTPLIRKIKDTLFTSLAFPISLFVGITFWGLYVVDRELVFPKVLDQFFPTWLNHVMHTNIMLFVVLELLASFRQYPPRQIGLSILTVFMLIYLVWIHVIHHYSGQWVYPILEVLSLPMRVVFFVLLLGLTWLLYIIGEKVNDSYWSKMLYHRPTVTSSAVNNKSKSTKKKYY